MEVYLISGLGADRRVFENIRLPEHSLKHIEWVKPENNESLADYARRLLPQIRSTHPVLVGVSFGGLVALEMSNYVAERQVILISSAKTFHSIPFLYRLAGSLRVHRIIPSFLLKHVNSISLYFFGIKGKEAKELFRSIMKDTDSAFLRWAIDKVVTWRNSTIPPNVFSIHGSKDRILPMRDSDYVIEGGGHFMIVDRADEVVAALRKTMERM